MAYHNNLNADNALINLRKAVSSCKKCSLYKTKTNDVFGIGPSDAKIMFIGEAPGKKEDIEGKPFVGNAGKILDQMLEENEISRKEVFITNILKHRPPANRDPEPEEIKACIEHLINQIKIINPQLIVLLGRHALNRFFPDMRISEVHGRVFIKKLEPKKTKQKFLALYHPAAAIYNQSLKNTLSKDFKEIKKLIKNI